MSKSILDDAQFVKEQVMASAFASYDVEPIYAFDPSI